jgi:hypothetical protein
MILGVEGHEDLLSRSGEDNEDWRELMAPVDIEDLVSGGYKITMAHGTRDSVGGVEQGNLNGCVPQTGGHPLTMMD